MLSFSLNNNKTNFFKVPESVKKVLSSEDGELNMDINSARSREWVSTWYFNNAKGRTYEDTDIKAYSYACEQNYRKAIAEREVAILSEEEVERGERGGIGEMFLKCTEKYFENIEERSEFESAVKNLFDMSDMIEIEDNVDIITAMLNALKGNLQSVKIIKALKDKYEKLGDILFSIMSVSNWADILTEMRGEIYC